MGNANNQVSYTFCFKFTKFYCIAKIIYSLGIFFLLEYKINCLNTTNNNHIFEIKTLKISKIKDDVRF